MAEHQASRDNHLPIGQNGGIESLKKRCKNQGKSSMSELFIGIRIFYRDVLSSARLTVHERLHALLGHLVLAPINVVHVVESEILIAADNNLPCIS